MQQAKSSSSKTCCFNGPDGLFSPHRLTGYVSTLRFIAQTCVMICALLAVNPASAQETGAETPNEALVKQVTEAVIKNLQENNGQVLDKAIDQGIQRYLDRQKAAREAARAEQVRMAQEKAKKVRHPSPDRDHIRGNPKAIISLIEYSDFECPYCKRFHDTAKKLLAAHGDELNWVWRYYPLSFHNPGTQSESEAAECAAELGGNDAFWRYTDAIIARTTSGGKGFPIDQLTPLAKELGLDGQAFQQCLDSGRTAGRVAEDLKEGASIGITGTPGNILLNNETGEVRVLSGALPQATFDASIKELLTKPVAANAQSQ
jgi:protein-disulfide isomerase